MADKYGLAPRQRQRARDTLVLNALDWVGFAPDLPAHIFGPAAATGSTVNLRLKSVAPPSDTGGLALTIDRGYEKADGDPTTLPLDSGDVIIRLHSFLRTESDGGFGGDASDAEFDLTIVAATAGDGTTSTSGKMYRIDSSGDWTEITYIAHNGYTSATGLTAARDGTTWSPSMPHSCVLASGSASHDPSASLAAGSVGSDLGLPTFIFTNNKDPVYVFPADIEGGTHTHKYTELHAGSLEPFISRTCVAWEGRVFYGDTSEAGTRYHQRVRWGSLFDASPDPAQIGSGALDVRELNGTVLRMQPLDPFLVVYYEDGIVFLERTGLSSAPISYRVVTDTRGLLGAHSMAQISPREHFIVGTDGFYILNASGEFREVGVIDTPNGTRFRKWHNYFFAKLDKDARQRIQCHYDQTDRSVRIVWPDENTGDQNMWTYDIENDQMIVENWSDFGGAVTCFEDHNDLLQAAIAWNSANAPATWEDATAFGGTTWASGAARFGVRDLYHGTANGNVYVHNDSVDTFNGSPQSWALETHRFALDDPRDLIAIDELAVEIVNLRNTNNMLMQFGAWDFDGIASSASANVDMVASGTFQAVPIIRRLYCRTSGSYFSVILSGEGGVGIRQVFLDSRRSGSRHR